MKTNQNKAGFTLIELLVVVLIIGILAGVALPQYQVAVTKTRYAALKNLTQSIYEAEQVYFLENGVYTNKFRELTLDIGGTGAAGNEFPWGVCIIELSNKYTYCRNAKINLAYLIDFAGPRFCITYGNDSLAKKICKQETNSKGNSAGWYQY